MWQLKRGIKKILLLPTPVARRILTQRRFKLSQVEESPTRDFLMDLYTGILHTVNLLEEFSFDDRPPTKEDGPIIATVRRNSGAVVDILITQWDPDGTPELLCLSDGKFLKWRRAINQQQLQQLEKAFRPSQDEEPEAETNTI